MTQAVKAAVYIRVGNPDQIDNDRQRAELLGKFGDKHQIIGEYRDTASGSQGVGDRPALKKLLEDAAKGEFDVLLCTDLTRLTRLPFSDVMTALKKAGVKVVGVDGKEIGVADLILANLARTESEHRGERIKRGIRVARERRRGESGSDKETHE